MNTDKELEGKHISLWLDTTPETNYPELSQDMVVDVLVIGGGIVGITTAFLLQKSGLKATIIEADRIIRGVTGNTTAKITAAHGLIYKYLIDNFGRENAQIYAEANQSAINKIDDLVRELMISCDFERFPAETYTVSKDEIDLIQAEVKAAQSLGLPVSLTTSAPLPFKIEAAIHYDDQARFHPRKYLLGLADNFLKKGGKIYEKTRVMAIEEGDHLVVKTKENIIKAKHIVVATNFPIYDPLAFFAKMSPRRSYVAAARLNGPVPQSMLYSTEESFHSFRPHPYSPQEELLLIGGEYHKTGRGGDTRERYKNLVKYAYENFDIKSIEYYWSTHDMASLDRIPYIGKLPERSDNIYVATGFSGWGMAHSMVAAQIIRDLIIKQDNPWAKLYNPTRLKLGVSGGKIIKENLNAAKEFIGDRMKKELEAKEEIETGEGKIVEIDGHKTALYKDEAGTVHKLSPKCTHLGCIVDWNSAEKSWDCPCHGSRYSVEGKVIQGPAVEDLLAQG